MASVSTQCIREILGNAEESDDFDLISATEELIALCDKLDEEPADGNLIRKVPT